MDELAQRLRNEGFRLTKERDALLKLFGELHRIVTPAEMHELAKEHGVNIGLTTVYRLFEALTKIGAAVPFLMEGTIYYAYCDPQHHHHVICMTCHRLTEVRGCPTYDGLPANWDVYGHRVDWFGMCPNCKDEASAH